MTSLLKNLFLLSVMLICGMYCRPMETRHPLVVYYFPYQELQKGVFYEFTPLNNSTFPPVYWFIQSVKEGEKWYLREIYIENDVPMQFTKEKIVSNGILAQQVDIFIQDTTGQVIEVNGEVLAGNSFSFDVQKGQGVLLSKYLFKIPDGTQNTTTVIKNRLYESDTTINIANREYQSVRFAVKEIVSMGNEIDGYSEPEFSGVECYAKGVGLVYYMKRTDERVLFEYGLKDRIPFDEAPDDLRQTIKQLLENED